MSKSVLNIKTFLKKIKVLKLYLKKKKKKYACD